MFPSVLVSFPVSLDPFLLLSDPRAGTAAMSWAKWQYLHSTGLAPGLLCVPCGDYVALKHVLLVFSFNLRYERKKKKGCVQG